ERVTRARAHRTRLQLHRSSARWSTHHGKNTIEGGQIRSRDGDSGTRPGACRSAGSTPSTLNSGLSPPESVTHVSGLSVTYVSGCAPVEPSNSFRERVRGNGHRQERRAASCALAVNRSVRSREQC